MGILQKKRKQLRVVLFSNTLLFMVRLAVLPVLEMCVYFYIPFVALC